MGELHNIYIDSAYNYIVHALNTLGELMDGRHTTLNRMLIIMASIFALVALTGAASATDYYVATWGDNTTQGNITHPWQNVSYAVNQLSPGDTLYLFDGTWYEEEISSMSSGNATHHVVITSYNGTPTLDGNNSIRRCFDIWSHSYIDLKDITIRNYYQMGVAFVYGHDFSIINVTVTGGDFAIYISGLRNATIDGGHFSEAGFSTMQLSAETAFLANVSVSNCVFNHSIDHGHLDMCCINGMSDINITGNIFRHAGTSTMGSRNHNSGPIERMNISDNVFINDPSNLGDGIHYLECNNLTFTNNSFSDYAGTDAIGAYIIGRDITSSDNVFTNCKVDMKMAGDSGYDVGASSINDTFSKLYERCGNLSIINPTSDDFTLLPYSNGTIAVNYTMGKVFDITFMSGRGKWIIGDIFYYPTHSNGSIKSMSYDGVLFSVESNNITLRPTCGHLSDVAVNTWDEASGTYRITASSTQRDNPTWVNLTTKAAYTTYNITRAGEPYTKATTGADGVLRYRHTSTWDGPQTFEFSYDSDGADPVPCVTNLRNDTPTRNTVTLRWDCSAPDIDHYTVYPNGAIPVDTGNKYYSATNLTPDTTYIFSVSATKDGITGDSVSITVRTAAEEAEDFCSNTVHIADDVTASHGHRVTVPIMIHNATGVACAGVKLTCDASVVTVTGATGGDFTASFKFDEGPAADGLVMINTYIVGTQLTGDVKVADVTFVAVGEVGATSTLDMEIISMADQSGYSVSGTVSNGLFTVVSDTSPPGVTDPSASQLIPDDTDGIPSWGETVVLNVTVTDESDITSVTTDLSAIGGSPVQPMTCIGGNVWSVTTNASAGTSPQTYDLPVCATDIHGYTNMSESVELVVMRNGDVTGDGDVKLDDVELLENYVTHPDLYTISSEFVANVADDADDDGMVNVADAMLLENYVTHPDQYALR